MLSIIKKKAGLASTTPLALLCRFLSSHIASWQKIFTHPDFREFANYAISYLQGYMGAESCPTTIDLTPWSQILSLHSHSLFNSLFFSSRLNITWSLLFRPLRRDLHPAKPLRSIIPQRLFQTSWRLWKNLNLFVLAQLSSPCGKFLLSWPDLRYLGIVGRKGRIPAWFKFLVDNILSSFNSFFFFSSFIINSSFTIASSLLLNNTVPDGQYRPLWALSQDRITQTLLVGCVCITYSKKGLAIMSHWLPAASPESTSFCPCSGCSHHVPKYAALSAIKRRCTSERCFLQVQLNDTVAYPTKNAKVFATGRPIKLSTSLAYTSSLAMVSLNFPSSDVIASTSLDDID
ncbi:hypothetical protein RhiirA5_439551 [Rhizophagus irregularis]|uniref:Uncharacterized protein n=1 Tax=Rhizophagus irregularis TaxID=588596 RepID=A0A2N0NHP0_9GLOM|nr:hypothetical protein RhiirA5_439551 [Rhizophagus irregularis]